MKKILVIKNNSHEGPGKMQEVFEEHGYTCDIRDLDAGDEFPSPQGYSAVIVMGGSDSAYDKTEKMKKEISRVQECLQLKIPYLGVCLGMQVLAKAAGGKVFPAPYKEVGFIHADGKPYTVAKLTDDIFFEKLPNPFRVFHLHGDTVEPGPNTLLIGKGSHIPNQFIKVGENAYGTQFHFELDQEIFNLWRTTDQDLIPLDQEALVHEWKKFQQEYWKIGRQITENFVRVMQK